MHHPVTIPGSGAQCRRRVRVGRDEYGGQGRDIGLGRIVLGLGSQHRVCLTRQYLAQEFRRVDAKDGRSGFRTSLERVGQARVEKASFGTPSASEGAGVAWGGLGGRGECGCVVATCQKWGSDSGRSGARRSRRMVQWTFSVPTA